MFCEYSLPCEDKLCDGEQDLVIVFCPPCVSEKNVKRATESARSGTAIPAASTSAKRSTTSAGTLDRPFCPPVLASGSSMAGPSDFCRCAARSACPKTYPTQR